MLLLYFSSIYK